jgi:20S proteasome subunit alpha 2
VSLSVAMSVHASDLLCLFFFCQDMELDDAVHVALLTMRESYEGEMTEHNIEVALATPDRVFRVLTPAEVRDYLDEAN